MPSKIIWLDYVRALACCMVILLHTAAEYVLKSNNTDWLIANIVDSFTRVCVPLFFMISGYLFFSTKTVKIKNFIKILTALTFYSFIAFIATILFHYIQPSSPLTFYFFAKPSFYHLWYFYPLIAIYLLSLTIKIRDIPFKTTLSIFLIFFTFFNPQIKNYFDILFNININNYFFIEGDFFYYILYGLLGASFHSFKNNTKKINYLIIYVISSLIIAYLTFKTSTDKLFPFYNYATPLVFISAFSFFAFFKCLENNIKESKFISLISKNSLGIYGIHAFLLYGISYITKFYLHSSIIFIPLIFFITLIASLFFSKLVKLVDKHNYIS